MCGEAYRSWPLERIEHLRAVLTRILAEKLNAPVTLDRIFPVDDNDRGGL